MNNSNTNDPSNITTAEVATKNLTPDLTGKNHFVCLLLGLTRQKVFCPKRGWGLRAKQKNFMIIEAKESVPSAKYQETPKW